MYDLMTKLAFLFTSLSMPVINVLGTEDLPLDVLLQ